MTLSNTTKLKGLYTFGNELIQPEGALYIADNVNIDEPNVVTQRRGFNDYADELANPNKRIRQLFSYKDVLIRHYDDKLEFKGATDFTQFAGSYSQLDPDIRIKSITANGNLYFTTSDGIKKISALSSSEFTSNTGYITNAGVPEALDVFGEVTYTSNGFLPPESKVAYKVMFGKKDINSNLLFGAPSSRYIVTNASKDVFTFEKTNLTFKSHEDFNAEKTTIVCGNKNNTNETNLVHPNSILKVHSSDNLHKYAFWFNKGTGIAPSLVGYTNVEVNIAALGASDNVAVTLYNAAIAANLTEISVTLSGTTTVIFENTIEGLTDGVDSPTGVIATDIGGGWTRTVNINGTDSLFIEKYFLVNTPTTNYCFYYGNSRTIADIPTDPGLLGRTFVGIQITNQSTKAFIANATYQALLTNTGTEFDLDLDVSVSNPLLTVTSTVGGDIDDITQGTINVADLEILVLNQGSITEGQFANVNVTFTVPTGIDTTYFYRIYRTAYSSVSVGVELNDIDPGEECNLVYEGSVNVSAGSQITVLDITSETFRNSGEPLYNNPISGEGILQSNNIPPIAVDLCTYKNYTFYANTKVNHQQTLSLVTVDDIVSTTSKFSIINKNVKRDYTFRGIATTHSLVCGTKANTKVHKVANPNSKIFFYSASDQTKYVIYFDDGTATTPSEPDSVLVRVDISALDASDNVAATLESTLAQFGDFEVTRSTNTLTIVNAENGPSTTNGTPTNIVTDIGTGWSITKTVSGLGEDIALGFVLLSKSNSVGIKLERTVRSLVNVINGDTLSPINAYYISSVTDLPGKFLLKARSIEDINFYSYVSNMSGADFNPEIPEVEPTFTFSGLTTGTKTRLTKTSHDFTNGESVYIYAPNAVPVINGSFEVTVINANTIEINYTTTSGNATDSFYFFPFEKSDNLRSPNRVYFSKFSQPEAVPIVNYVDIGTKDAQIERILALRDYLFIFKTDGIYMLSGENGFWTVRMIDVEKILCPDSATVLNNQIYMLSGSGVLAVNENSPMIISRMIENKFQSFANFKSLVRRQGFGVTYEDDRAYILWVPTDSTDEVCTQAFRYNILEKNWTRWTKSATAGIVIEDGKTLLYIADGDRPIVMEERKNLDRTDFADNVIPVELGFDSYLGNGRYRLSDVSEVSAGDVLTQTQYVNVSEYNRLLEKLDIDVGLNYTNFFSDFEAKITSNLSQLLSDLNDKLMELDTSGTVTSHFFDNNDWAAMQVEYNNLMAELNDVNCVTEFKNYKESSGTLMFEYVITKVTRFNNEVVLYKSETSLVQGKIDVYKHIKSVVQTNPIHFGNPSSFKQVSKGYLLFDQNNFFTMLLQYATDLSQNFEGREFFGKGTGFWGYGTWGMEEKNYWGGDGNDAPKRVVIPRNKQRCRYITVKFTHNIARDAYRVVGVAHDVREFSSNAYR